MPSGHARNTLVQYVEMKRLANMGFTQSLDAYDADTVEAFLIVDAWLDHFREEDRPKH